MAWFIGLSRVSQVTGKNKHIAPTLLAKGLRQWPEAKAGEPYMVFQIWAD